MDLWLYSMSLLPITLTQFTTFCLNVTWPKSKFLGAKIVENLTFFNFKKLCCNCHPLSSAMPVTPFISSKIASSWTEKCLMHCTHGQSCPLESAKGKCHTCKFSWVLITIQYSFLKSTMVETVIPFILQLFHALTWCGMALFPGLHWDPWDPGKSSSLLYASQYDQLPFPECLVPWKNQFPVWNFPQGGQELFWEHVELACVQALSEICTVLLASIQFLKVLLWQNLLLSQWKFHQTLSHSKAWLCCTWLSIFLVSETVSATGGYAEQVEGQLLVLLEVLGLQQRTLKLTVGGQSWLSWPSLLVLHVNFVHFWRVWWCTRSRFVLLQLIFIVLGI